MTKQEAISFSISTGKPITHTTFTPDEYVVYRDGELIDEAGYSLPIAEFWSIRSGGIWEDDWREFVNN